MSQREYTCWRDELRPSLAKENIHFKEIDQLNKSEFTWLRAYFRREVFPVLTPLAVDPTHPFPLILNKSLNLFVSLRNLRKKQAAPLKAVVQVPRILPRLVQIESSDTSSNKSYTFVFLSDVVRHFVSDLFPGHEAIGAWAFRITRNSHLYVDEEEVENLLLSIEDELHNRRRGAAVRLEIDDSIDDDVLQYLLQSLNLSEKDVLKIHGPINLYRLMKLPDLVDRDDLKFPSFEPFIPKALASRGNLFEQIAEKDHLLHHPYDSFNPMVDFLRQAAIDPEVFAIKAYIIPNKRRFPYRKSLDGCCSKREAGNGHG